MCLGLIKVILLFQMESAFQVCVEYLNRGQRLERNTLKKPNDPENCLMPQIIYQIMRHIILKLYIQFINLKK